jgi:hypothetical protein
MSLEGLGRVITRRRGCRRTSTGGMHFKVTVSSVFFPISVWEANLLHHRGVLTGSPALQRLQPDPCQAAIAAISGLMPTMFMTRVKL